METLHIAALISVLSTSIAVSTTIDPDLFLKAEQKSKAVIEVYDAKKTAEYDQICQLLKGCIKDGNSYVL